MNEKNDTLDNIQLPTFFAFQILLKMNKLSNIHSSELNISDEQWPNIGKKLAERVWKSRKELNEQKDTIQNPTSLENYYSAFPLYLTGIFVHLILFVIFKLGLLIFFLYWAIVHLIYLVQKVSYLKFYLVLKEY